MSKSANRLTGTITDLLEQAKSGKQGAIDALFQRVYPELRSLAGRLISGKAYLNDPSATVLLNQACERLLERECLSATDRRHFFFLFGRVLNDVLVDQARHDLAIKRGRGHRRVQITDFTGPDRTDAIDALDLSDALRALRAHDPESAEIVHLRFFCGQTLAEAAQTMQCTLAIARQHWAYAKVWLIERLRQSEDRPIPK